MLHAKDPRAARLLRDLVIAHVKSGVAENQRLVQLGIDCTDYQRAVGAANSQIARSDAVLNRGNVQEAYRTASATFTTLAQAADQQRQKLAPAAPLTSFPPASGDNIAGQVEFQKSLESLRPGENLLTGGEFEDLGELMQLGWQHVSQPLPGVQPKAELSAQTPHSGRYCLQLSAEASPRSAAPQIVGRPLVRITSPPVHVAAGDVLEITGWVRVPKPIVGNIDGLTIVDSLGGPELAIHVRQSADWQQFRLIRGANESADETVTFLLNGLGAASIDDVSIHMLGQPSARRLPSTAPRRRHLLPSRQVFPRCRPRGTSDNHCLAISPELLRSIACGLAHRCPAHPPSFGPTSSVSGGPAFERCCPSG